MYICPLPLEPPSLTHPTPIPLLEVVTEHQAELPVCHSNFPLDTYFTYSNVYISLLVLNGLPRWQWERIHRPMQETQEMWVPFLGPEDPLGKKMASHCSILAWKVPRTEEPGGLLFRGSQRVQTRLSNWSRAHTRCTYFSAAQFVPPSFPSWVHKSVLYVCVSIPALQIGSSAPFF